MMTKDRIRIIFVAALLSLPAAEASDFEGAYVGGKIGYNTNSPSSGSTSNDLYPGIEAGYGWAVGQALVGLDAFADGHYKSITSNDYGADVKLGLPTDRFLPYLKLGLAASEPGTRFHGGLGIEYKFAPQWAVSGEWTTDSKTVDSIDQKNNNISVGLTYYFNAPVVAPVAMAPPAPVVAKEPEPVIAPAPVIA
jgi:outer membrane immunogenic protein